MTRRFMGWVTLVAVLVACVAAGVGAKALAQVAWDAVVGYDSPYTDLVLPPATHGSAEASRTVFVIIDGLRADASRTMGTLNAMRSYGADITLTAPEPSLSYPNWTTLLTGAPPARSGVVTNWHEGGVQAETLFDTARAAQAATVFVGPKDFDTLYGVSGKVQGSFMRTWQKDYLTDMYVDEAIRLSELDPRLMVLHLPDIDEAGHAHGGASAEYAQAVARIDSDLNRLVHALSDGHTVFVITSDHGHIDTGGHGGWEAHATRVPCVVAGPGVKIGTGEARQVDVASSVAVLAGIGVPRMTTGLPLEAVETSGSAEALAAARDARDVFDEAAAESVMAQLGMPAESVSGARPGERLEQALALMAQVGRNQRIPVAAVAVLACLAAVMLVGLASWRALVAALVGAVAYYATFLGLYFGIHRYEWSLSAFNSEDRIGAWMNGRIAEAALATFVAALVAALVYPLLRAEPKGARGPYLAGWLSLGPVTALVILATLGLQIAWFYWGWGVDPAWDLPDLRWGFKFDIDLVQATAVGFAAVVTPLVSFVVGRYHPKVRNQLARSVNGHQRPA